MGAQNSGDDDEITGINVTPLVDVMLVLLIIFMVTTTYIVHKSISIKLPKADTGEELSSTKNLAFALDAKSKLYLDGKPISYSEITISIAKIREQNKTKKVELQALIAADQKTPHGEVVKLIDMIRKNGITDFAINVEQGN